MSVVTDEMVEVAAEAMWNAMPHATRYVKLTDAAKRLARRMARAALAAGAPLIAKAERERVLQVLSAHEAGYAKARASYQAAQNAEMTAFVGGKETAIGVAIHAIRALGDEG